MNERKLKPEILDELASDNPDAIRSRKDLSFVNRVMGNYEWLSAQMAEGGHWLELGAGSGDLASHIFDPKKFTVGGVDFAPRPSNWPENWPWHQGDLFEVLGDLQGDVTGIAANMFLHHFTHEELGEIGKLIPSGVRHLVFCETARYFSHKMQGVIGFPLFNYVTRHDMMASIDAGFREDELAESLQLNQEEWTWQYSHEFLGSHRFEAHRK